eukprot:674407-Prorocentrum_minimum.AAC.1
MPRRPSRGTRPGIYIPLLVRAQDGGQILLARSEGYKEICKHLHVGINTVREVGCRFARDEPITKEGKSADIWYFRGLGETLKAKARIFGTGTSSSSRVSSKSWQRSKPEDRLGWELVPNGVVARP